MTLAWQRRVQDSVCGLPGTNSAVLLRKVGAMGLLSENPPFKPNVVIRGLEALQVGFQPA
ncbi:hypothetical protein ACFXG4_50585 [Nocardia sp. NPDC059246]|uniref:hypothetical protein n=1 Tax=unclassified Nocardia TaxID=2637762 RepID=UPI0036C5D1AB